jgi:hypothetical protein
MAASGHDHRGDHHRVHRDRHVHRRDRNLLCHRVQRRPEGRVGCSVMRRMELACNSELKIDNEKLKIKR